MLEISGNARKIPKSTEKIPTDLESAQIANKSQKYSNKLFFWLEKSGKKPKKLQKIPEYIYIFYKNQFDAFHPLNGL